ncbi:hypothetical protein HJFPF1_05020 [Paramyrothecium foliicola]|nr:hypothetical protein HJFPF1_05020 [Paramyrothecium foliicola]
MQATNRVSKSTSNCKDGGRKSRRIYRVHPREIARERAREKMKEPFFDDRLEDDTPPETSLERFQQPLLRRCRYDLGSVIFAGRVNSTPKGFRGIATLDGGLDGFY